MRINNNLSALTAFNALAANTNALSKTIRQLSTGLRINSAADDASGLAVSERIRARIAGLDAARNNSLYGISLLHTADGALGDAYSVLNRMRELAVQAASDTLTAQERSSLQNETDELIRHLNLISESTQFNRKKLLNGEAGASYSSSNPAVKARIKGGLSGVDESGKKAKYEGNYNINIEAYPGKAQVQKTSIMSVMPSEIVKASPKVLFLIDVSGSMGDDIDIVRENVANFVNNIKKEGVDSVEIGICLYNARDGARAMQYDNGTLWSGSLESISSALSHAKPDNGDMDNYSAVLSAVSLYGSTFGKNVEYKGKIAQARYMIVVTDVDHSNTDDGELLAALKGDPSLIDDDIQLSAVCPSGEDSEFAELAENTGGVILGIRGNWSTSLTDTLAGQISESAVISNNFPPEPDTHLSVLEQFVSSDGRNLFDDPQTITIHQGGKSTSVNIYANDTLERFVEKLNNAIGLDLGNAKYTYDSNHFAEYVHDSKADTSQSVEGTIVICSGIPGKAGELHFSGNEELLNALGLNTIQESSENIHDLTVSDAHSGEIIARDMRITGNTAYNLFPNVDLEFSPMSGLFAEWNDSSKEYVFRSQNFSAVLHLKDESLKLQIGANEGENFIIQLCDISSDALGVSKISLATHETSSRAITVIDNAMDKVLAERAKTGAQINALEFTSNNLESEAGNLLQAESRIKDADIAKYITIYTKILIMRDTESAVLAQANQLPQSVLSLMQ